jgi:very-short-patch-repair endonuclease
MRARKPTDDTVILEHWRQEGIPHPVTEYRFHPRRRWRLDYAWPASRLALEVEGGIWRGGRHNRPTGFLRDIEKYNSATAMGWALLRCVPATICSAATISDIRRVLVSTEVVDHQDTRARIGEPWLEIIRRFDVDDATN